MYRGILIFLFLIFNVSSSFGQLTSKDTAQVQFINSRKFFIYKVEKGETLYSISQKFKIPQEEILQFNKEVVADGLKNKMRLWVPAYSWLNKDTAQTVVVKPAVNETYKIAVVTGLNLPKVYTGEDTSMTKEILSKDVKDNLEFVEGIFSSAEIHKNKYKVHIHIIDSEGDSIKLITKLKKQKDFNLIITNETGTMLKTISAFSETYNVKLLSCGVNTYDLLKSNGNAFALMPSSNAQCEEAGVFASAYFKDATVIAMRTATWKENEYTESFATGWRKNSDKKIKRPDYSKGGADAITDSLNKTSTNVIFIPTSNEEIVSSVLNALKEKSTDYKINVIGLPTWQFFETVDQRLLEICNVHLFSSGMIDYSTEAVTTFRKYFREKYNTEPSDISFQGYDAYTIMDSFLNENGSGFFPDDNQKVKGIYSDYHFLRSDSKSCFENRIIHVFQPSKVGYADLAKTVKIH